MESLFTAREGGPAHWDRPILFTLWFVHFLSNLFYIVLTLPEHGQFL